jgi:hypothetical protein
MKLETLALADWIVVEFLSDHEVNDVLDVWNGNRALRDICRNDHFSLSLHIRCVFESSVLLFLTQRAVEWDQLEMVHDPLAGIEVIDKFHELEDFVQTWHEDKDAFLLFDFRVVLKLIVSLNDVANDH